MEVKFYVCEHCGNIVTKVKDSGVSVVCCGEKMKELVSGASGAAVEKHMPVWQQDGNMVQVSISTVTHPMEEKHYIQWIALQTSAGVQIKYLQPGQEPKACFALCEGEKVEAVFEYCNLHGLWKAE